MKRATRYRTLGVVVTLVASGFIALAACSNQGEGDRCEIANGNDDCKTDEDLICYMEKDLSVKGADRCCPRDRSKATHPACFLAATVGGGDATAPADTGPPPTVVEAGAADADADVTTDAADAAEGG